MKLDPADRAIQAHAPVVMAPNLTPLEPLAASGHRFVAARNGLFLEVRRPWLHLCWPMHDADAIDPIMPFGAVDQRISLAFKLPRDLTQRFLDEARKAAPFEHAAWLVWNDQAKALEYRDLDIQSFGEGYVRYNRPALEEHESLAVDLHSHGAMPAFFSPTDDEDDAGEVKLAAVVGDLADGKQPSWALRLCALGLYVNLPGPKAA